VRVEGHDMVSNLRVDGGKATVEEMLEHNANTYKKIREYKTILHGQEVTVKVYDYIEPEKRSYDTLAKHVTAQQISADTRSINESGWVPENTNYERT
jgi:creatinine amidohydrolase/Fe(II)-dependent formamide hydrolase-like protein